MRSPWEYFGSSLSPARARDGKFVNVVTKTSRAKKQCSAKLLQRRVGNRVDMARDLSVWALWPGCRGPVSRGSANITPAISDVKRRQRLDVMGWWTLWL